MKGSAESRAAYGRMRVLVVLGVVVAAMPLADRWQQPRALEVRAVGPLESPPPVHGPTTAPGFPILVSTPTSSDVGPPPMSTPRATLPCRNSTDPACGPFRWDPPPGPDQPLEIQVTYSPSAPRVGEEVAFVVSFRQGDSRIARDSVTIAFGDERQPLIIPPLSCATPQPAPTGPWTPPRATSDAFVVTHRHAYDRHGDYTFHVYAASAEFLSSPVCEAPYASQGTATVTVHVAEA